ncbi:MULTISPECIES: DUF4240 domain-containing protein [unclassified Kitasatospora]|uniref:DUF4240 domain-containing protein n=1 Tax=unclassified Kitasatospora TaxID=2633591 RepID=UPI0034039BDA
METDEFWRLIETARSQAEEGGTFDQALVGLLAARSKCEVLEYQERFDELHGALYRWDIWAAAYLIGGGCSDDSFIDFRAGVIAQGRAWYERIALNPDVLAEHPLVVASAAEHDDDVLLFYEVVNYSAAYAFQQLPGDDEDFYEAWNEYWNAHARERVETDMGEDFDFDDAEQMHRRLPRLAALHLPKHPG